MIRNGQLLAELLLPEVDRQVELLRLHAIEWDVPCVIDGHNLLEESDDGDGWLHIDEVVFQFMNRRRNARWKRYVETFDAACEDWAGLPQAEAPDALWSYFDNRVDLASLALFGIAPDDFLLFRDLGFQEELFDGLGLLVEDFPYLQLPFRYVSRVARGRYEAFNEALQRLARDLWPDAEGRPARLLALVYRVLPELVRHRDDAFRAWVGVTAQRHNIEGILDPTEETNNWSSVRRAQPGDLYFAYCASPVSAIRAVFTVDERPTCDPVGAWRGHWVQIRRHAMFTLSFAEMKSDPILGKWSAIRHNFQGITMEQVPPAIYARIRELLIARGVEDSVLRSAEVTRFLSAGDFQCEKDF